MEHETDEDRIIDRGRGPEITGTRVTVYSVMDFLKYGYLPEQISAHLGITGRQVRAALHYIQEHGEQVEADYRLILDRVNQPNPPEVEAVLAKTPEELRRRILGRRGGGRVTPAV